MEQVNKKKKKKKKKRNIVMGPSDSSPIIPGHKLQVSKEEKAGAEYPPRQSS